MENIFDRRDLLISFKYDNLLLETYYIGDESVGYTIFIDNIVVYSNNDYKPSPIYNQDDNESIITLLSFIVTFVAGNYKGTEDLKAIESLVDWVNKNGDNIVLMIYDFELSEDEDYLQENELSFEEAIKILTYIINVS